MLVRQHCLLLVRRGRQDTHVRRADAAKPTRCLLTGCIAVQLDQRPIRLPQVVAKKIKHRRTLIQRWCAVMRVSRPIVPIMT